MIDHPRVLALCSLLLLPSSLWAQGYQPGSLSGPPSPAEIDRHRLEEARLALESFDVNSLDPKATIRLLEKQAEGVRMVSILSNGLRVAQHAAAAGRLSGESRWTKFAVKLADILYRRYVLPSGAFIERDRAPWIEPARGWRTIPWGVNFRGNEVLDAYQTLQRDLSPEQAAWWKAQLHKLAGWIHRNPMVGSLVFNASIDICRLHWRLGREFDQPEWQKWALEAAHERIRRDIDKEGWIHGESGGASGVYQMVGARHLADFALDARDPVIDDATRRVFRGAVAYAAPDLSWNGNFGTRSAALATVPPSLILAAARLGEPEAIYLTRRFGRLSWSSDASLWKAAFSQPGRAPEPEPVRSFAGIESTVLREGPWVIYLNNYSKSHWVRGFSGLWHSGFDNWIFSGLHSLPTKDDSVNKKMNIDDTDTSDWSGMPHVRVIAQDGRQFDSHQKMEGLTASGEKGRVTAQWSEPLLDRDGASGGRCDFRLTAAGEALDVLISARDLAGAATLDYHVLHRPVNSAALWAGDEVERIAAGKLPLTGGMGSYEGRSFSNPPSKFAIQIDRAVLGFEVLQRPANAKVVLGVVKDEGLHSSNLGGFRLRFEVPPEKNFELAVRIRKLN